ncbi:MAG: hypothetical protein ACFFDI_24400 [Promethearchaeota archaeon]
MRIITSMVSRQVERVLFRFFTHYSFLFPENLSKDDFYKTLDQYIDVYIHGNLYLCHYNDTRHYDAIVRSTTFFRHCRGMTINSEGKIVNLPFLRFLEYDYADESMKINWQNALAEEKHDGSLINVFYTNQQWYIATRRRIDVIKDLQYI